MTMMKQKKINNNKMKMINNNKEKNKKNMI